MTKQKEIELTACKDQHQWNQLVWELASKPIQNSSHNRNIEEHVIKPRK